jgi:leader peptidase (prepilin peptidase)/N-methyltransferase
LVFSLLIIISAYDIRHQIIPNKFVYTLIILSLFSIFWNFGHWDLFRNWDLEIRNSGLFNRFLSGVIFGGFFAALWLVSKGRWMGLGDAKIALAMGWLLGLLNGFIALFSSFWIGAIFGIALLLFAPKKFKLKSRIPFGPFLNLGILIAFLFGNDILQIYLNIIGL